MTTFDENGFLEGRIHSWIESQRVSHKDVFERAWEFNRDCHRFLDGRAVNLGNGKQIVACLLFARSLELYQSIIVVSERGMAAATRVMFRGFLEASFQFFAIQRDPTYLNEYIDQFLIQKRKLLRRIRQSKSSQLDGLRQAATAQLVEETEKAIAQGGVREIRTEDVARRAQMHDYLPHSLRCS